MKTIVFYLIFFLSSSFLYAQVRLSVDGTGVNDDVLHLRANSPFIKFCSGGDCTDDSYYRAFIWSQNAGGGVYHLNVGTSYTNYYGDVRFFTGGGSVNMVIRPSSFVGIGTTNPGYKLHVVGGSSTAVTGQSTNGYGLYGTSTYTAGIYGSSGATGSAGMYGVSPYIGVQGITTNNTSNSGRQGVRGDNYGSATGWAGYFYGNLGTSGTLYKGAGGFRIDHPLDPENKFLYHSFVESPDMKNFYDGIVTTNSRGEAEIELPEWFEAVNKEFRYQLTVIGEFAQAIVTQEVTNNRFRIKTDKPSVKVSWQVTGVRKDRYAEEHRLPVEEDKAPNQKGKYLHPDVYGKPREQAIDYLPPIKAPDNAISEVGQEEQLEEKPESVPPATPKLVEKSSPEMGGHFIQTQPNPFNGSTTIWYKLPEDAQDAKIMVTDLYGRQVQTFTISAAAKNGSVEFNGSNLPEGNYTYTLVVNGKVLEGRQMVMTK